MRKPFGIPPSSIRSRPCIASLASAGVIFGLLAVGCTNRQVKIQMRAGESGPERVFETNRVDDEELQKLSEAYENGPVRRAEGEDGVRFEASFKDRDLPSELGNRNGWSSLPGEFGTAYLYIEQFGDVRDDWTAFRSRMDAGKLWIELGVAFFEGRIEDEEARVEWRRFADEELVPDLMSAFLRFTANGFVQQGQRVDYRFRTPTARGPRTDDEWFQVQVFTPLVGFAVERGWITAEEGQLVLLSGVDGWVSAGERAWSRSRLADPIIERNVQRFVPEARPGRIGPENDQLILLGLAFLWWVNTSDDAAQVMLASPAISEEQKSRLRAGNRFIDIPGPFGIPIGGGERPLESEVVLETGAEPFITNGNWDQSLGTVTFETDLYPPEQRRRMAPPVFHASWSVPDAGVQAEVFGDVVLVGRDLAEVAFWERTLDEEDRSAWTEVVLETRKSGDLSGMADFVESLEGEGKDDRPAPLGLRGILFDEKGGTEE